jgi:hypothetical protein
MRNDPARSRDMQTAVGQHGEQQGVFTRGASDRDAEVGLLFGQVQDLGAVREHRWSRLPRIQTARVDLGDMSDQHRLHTPGSSHELAETTEKFVIRETEDHRELTLE